MSLRDLPASFASDVVAEIDARLAAVAREHEVSVPLAIESGSRAWGFPSPDSDYDCRFVFVRPADHYLSLWQRRDVIETPLERELDVNGWDLRKAIKLLLKGNAVIVEWLRSPIIYHGEAWFRDACLEFANRFTDRNLIGRHYLHLGEQQRRNFFGDGQSVAQKKIFYVLRPAATLRWLRLHEGRSVAPMHLPTLMRECNPPEEIAAEVSKMIAQKAVAREMGVAPISTSIATFIDAEFEQGRALFSGRPHRHSEKFAAEADAFFRGVVSRYDKTRDLPSHRSGTD